MKVQSIERECQRAIVGTAVEFSNTEISTLCRLAYDVDNIVDKARYDNAKISSKEEKITSVEVGLPIMMKIQYLLNKIVGREYSDLFREIDFEYDRLINCDIDPE